MVESAGARPVSRQKMGWTLATLLLLIIGGPATMFVMLSATGMVGGSPVVRAGALWLAPIGLLAGLAVCIVGGIRRRAGERSPLPAAAAGWSVFLGSAAVALVLGAG